MIHKTITYSLVTCILVINTIIIYLLNQTTHMLLNTELMIKLIGTVFILILSNTLIFQANISQRAIYKKNFLRLNILMLLGLIISSFYQRYFDYINGNIISLTIIQTSLYVLLLLITLFLLKDLRRLIQKLFFK